MQYSSIADLFDPVTLNNFPHAALLSKVILTKFELRQAIPVCLITFFQRLRIARSADRCNIYDKSVCLSVCPSHSGVLSR